MRRVVLLARRQASAEFSTATLTNSRGIHSIVDQKAAAPPALQAGLSRSLREGHTRRAMGARERKKGNRYFGAFDFSPIDCRNRSPKTLPSPNHTVYPRSIFKQAEFFLHVSSRQIRFFLLDEKLTDNCFFFFHSCCNRVIRY